MMNVIMWDYLTGQMIDKCGLDAAEEMVKIISSKMERYRKSMPRDSSRGVVI